MKNNYNYGIERANIRVGSQRYSLFVTKSAIRSVQRHAPLSWDENYAFLEAAKLLEEKQVGTWLPGYTGEIIFADTDTGASFILYKDDVEKEIVLKSIYFGPLFKLRIDENPFVAIFKTVKNGMRETIEVVSKGYAADLQQHLMSA